MKNGVGLPTNKIKGIVMSIPIRSLQSSMSNVLASVPVLIDGDFLMLIPIIFHIIRYIVNFDKSKALSRKQLYLIPLTIIDYIIILYHIKNNKFSIPLGIISGLISFYFIYIEYESLKDHLLIDILMMVFLFLLKRSSNTLFFSMREIVYHSLEFFIFYLR